MHRERAVVVGEALGDPQARRVVLVLVVEGPEFHGPQPLHVPRVEVLVAGEFEPPQVALARARRPPARHQHRRVLVLEAASRLGEHVEEDVLAVGELAPDLRLRLDDLLQVLHRLRAVPHAGLALVHQVVFYAADLELVDRRVARHHRRVDERVEVGRAEGARRDFCQRADDRLPRVGEVHCDLVDARALLGERHEGRRAVDHREAALDPVAADTHLAAVDAVGEDDRGGPARVDTPAVLPRLLDTERLAVRSAGGDVLDVLGVLADEIGARRPDRHQHLDLRPAAGRDRHVHLDVVRLRGRERDRVAERVGRRRGSGLCHRGRHLGQHQNGRREREDASQHAAYCNRG